MLTPVHLSGTPHFGASPTPVGPHGAFSIVGVTPGRYRVRAGLLTLRVADDTWHVKSATVNGRDAVDEPIELRTSVEGVVVTLTDRMPGLSGVVRDASGQAAASCHVVVFAKDRKYWVPESSRLTSVRPASDGSYLIRSVPAGDYFVTAVNDLEARRVVRSVSARTALQVCADDHAGRRRERQPRISDLPTVADVGGRSPPIENEVLNGPHPSA